MILILSSKVKHLSLVGNEFPLFGCQSRFCQGWPYKREITLSETERSHSSGLTNAFNCSKNLFTLKILMSGGAAHNYYPWISEMFISARTLIFSLVFLYRSCEATVYKNSLL